MEFPQRSKEKQTIIGSYHFVFEDENCKIPEGEEAKFEALPEEYSHLYLALEGTLAAVICIEDPLREEAADVIKKLKKGRNHKSCYDDRRQRENRRRHRKTCWR